MPSPHIQRKHRAPDPGGDSVAKPYLFFFAFEFFTAFGDLDRITSPARVLLGCGAPCVATMCFVKSKVNASMLEVLSVVSLTPSDSQRIDSLYTVSRKKPCIVLL